MINIKIAFLSLLTDITGTDEISLLVNENSTIKEVLAKLILDFGEEFEKIILSSPDFISKYIIIGLNGKDVRSLNNLNTIISQGDELVFLPAIAGG